MMSYDERKAFDEEQKNKGGMFSLPALPAIPGVKKEEDMMAGMDAAKDAMMGGEM